MASWAEYIGDTTLPAKEKIVEYLRHFNTTWLPLHRHTSLSDASLTEEAFDYFSRLQLYLASRSSVENTTALITVLTFLALLMSSWSSRFGSWSGRFSPFGRNPAPSANQVSDADYSYITSEDLQRAQERSSSPVESGPARDKDVLVLKCKRVSYPIHFPAYSIARGELRVGDIRAQAARETDTSDARRIKLLHKGKNLKDDGRSCRAEGLKEGAEIMCVVGEAGQDSPSSSDSEEESAALDSGAQDGEGSTRRKRVRNKNRKKKGKKPSATAAPSTSQATPSVPVTPLEKLAAVNHTLQGLLPQCVLYLSNPPTDPAKKDFEHKRLSETILAQVLIKLDSVDTEGDPDARARRKELVKEAQRVLTSLDEAQK